MAMGLPLRVRSEILKEVIEEEKRNLKILENQKQQINGLLIIIIFSPYFFPIFLVTKKYSSKTIDQTTKQKRVF